MTGRSAWPVLRFGEPFGSAADAPAAVADTPTVSTPERADDPESTPMPEPAGPRATLFLDPQRPPPGSTRDPNIAPTVYTTGEVDETARRFRTREPGIVLDCGATDSVRHVGVIFVHGIGSPTSQSYFHERGARSNVAFHIAG